MRGDTGDSIVPRIGPFQTGVIILSANVLSIAINEF